MTPDQDLSARLLPCPFCGGVARLALGEHAFDGAEVMCVKCGCQGGHHENDATGAEAITAWNRRVPADHERAVQAAVAKAVEAERAECLKLADDQYGEGPNGSYDNGATIDGWNMATQAIAAAIRSRGVEG